MSDDRSGARFEIEVRGTADADEIAAVVAAISQRETQPVETQDNYERWRRGRLTALARSRR